MRLCRLVAPRAGSRIVPPPTSIGNLACLEQRQHCPPCDELCSVPMPVQRTRATSGCNATCHLPSRVSLCVAARPCRPPHRASLLSLSRLQLLPGGSLQIDPIQVQDSGYYLCMASSPAGSDQRGLDLHILGKWKNQARSLLGSLPSNPPLLGYSR